MYLDLSGRQLDVPQRKFKVYFLMPGEEEAQKVDRLMEIFSKRYCVCNTRYSVNLKPSLKPERRMRVEDLIKNLRGIDDCHDSDKDISAGVSSSASSRANSRRAATTPLMRIVQLKTMVGPDARVP
ncbi:GL12807 [Drosophila persimilis]|uniref:GL12807 n=1 Tax=Drosophila persimilis TaxID=7234 RepID=B4H7Q9_DROPE|nr:GL12807 [Drosophila persimilis]